MTDKNPTENSPREEYPRVPISFDPCTGLQIRRAAIIVLLTLGIGFLAAGFQQYGQETDLARQAKAEAEERPVVDVATAENAPATETLMLPGETHAWYETTIYARINGYISNWSADIGDHVRKGQVLATIDTPDVDAQLAASEAKLRASEAQEKVSQSKNELAKATYDRVWNAPKGVVSDEERDQSKAEYDSSLAQVAEASSQVNLSVADVENLRALTAFKQVRAPFDGVVTARHVDIGQLVTAGSTSNTTSLYGIAQTDKVRIFTDVPESASVQIKDGCPVQITADEIPGQIFKGVVSRNSERINPDSKTLKVEVDIPNADQRLLTGMYVDVSFQLSQKEILQIPASALVYKSSGPQVAVVDNTGKVAFHDVTIANDEGNVVDISSGIIKGQRVALNIGDQISEGDRVTATDVEENAGRVN